MHHPSHEIDLWIHKEIQDPATPPHKRKASCIYNQFADLDHWVGLLTPRSCGTDELLVWLVANIRRVVWEECRATT